MRFRQVEFGRVCWLGMIAFVVFGTQLRAQNALSVQFPQDPKRNTSIGMFTRGGVLYSSLNDLTTLLSLRSYYNAEARKLEFRSGEYSVKVTADNSYVVIIDRLQNASIVQLPANVVHAANAFFVPTESFIPILRSTLGIDILYDRSRRSITVNGGVPRSRFDISGVQFEQKANGFLIRLQCSRKLVDYESWLKPQGSDTWLYVTLADAKADVATIQKLKTSGIVKKILVFQSATSVQLTFRLKGEVSSTELIPADGSNDILIAVHTPTEAQLASRKAKLFEQNLQRERDRWKLDVVVIDAGHGGEDPGTIGVSRVKEKDVTLAIALKVGALIQKHLRDVEVVYTRTTDVAVPLFRRGQIANERGGKLFVSIHCNSMPRKPHPTNGFEIYLLRPGKTENAIRIAERENAVVKYEEGYEQRYQQLTEENFILLTMAQSAYVKYSEQFADVLQQEMAKHSTLSSNGVKQAGFWVLVGASMPNVLVETGYLSNKDDERVLTSPSGQQRIAQAIFNGIRRYRQEYERSITEGREIGSN
jgi:N-acetylmuramoyl-L-alanine amidase